MAVRAVSTARFDTRISKTQKEFFEYAASIGGFRSLTEFFIYALQEKAKQILEEHHAVLATQKDREIFFKALTHPPKANARLRSAVKKHQKAVKK